MLASGSVMVAILLMSERRYAPSLLTHAVMNWYVTPVSIACLLMIDHPESDITPCCTQSASPISLIHRTHFVTPVGTYE